MNLFLVTLIVFIGAIVDTHLLNVAYVLILCWLVILLNYVVIVVVYLVVLVFGLIRGFNELRNQFEVFAILNRGVVRVI